MMGLSVVAQQVIGYTKEFGSGFAVCLSFGVALKPAVALKPVVPAPRHGVFARK
jgi:hypothetical protein